MDEFLEGLRVQVLQTQPGDIVVMSFPGQLSVEHAARISEAWKSICPHTDVRCVVLSEGGHIDSVIRDA